MLAAYVRSLLNRVKRNGGTLTPAELSDLEKQASRAFDGAFSTVTVPFAPVTWEAGTVLKSSESRTGRIDLAFNRPVEIVGFLPVVVSVGAQTTRDATLNDIAACLDIDRQNFRTNSKDETSHDNYCVLASLDSRVRNVGIVIESATPSMGATFRWRVPTNTCKDALVSLTCFVRWLDNRSDNA